MLHNILRNSVGYLIFKKKKGKEKEQRKEKKRGKKEESKERMKIDTLIFQWLGI